MSAKTPAKPSQRMLRIWARRLARGRARPIPVFVGGAWSLQILRGHKRVLRLPVGGPSEE